MTLNDVVDRILSTVHSTVFVCLHKGEPSKLFFADNAREVLRERRADICWTGDRGRLIVTKSTGVTVNLRLVNQDMLVDRPDVLRGYAPDTPMFTEYRGGWAESTIR